MVSYNMSLVVRKSAFAYAKTKTQINFAVTAKLISAFVSASRIVQFLIYLNPKFQASSHLLWLYSPVCVGPGRKPRRPLFSQRGSYMSENQITQRKKQTITLLVWAINRLHYLCSEQETLVLADWSAHFIFAQA